jgi:hypothetical protein
MAVIRLVVDVVAADGDVDKELHEYNQALHKLVHGVFTDTNLTGKETVTVKSHIHVSNRSYNCDTCDELRYDGIS